MDRKKSLEVAVTGALAGLMTGAAIGIATAPSHSDIGRDEFSIFGISAVAAGFSVGRKKTGLFDYLLGVGFANAFYRVGYHGTRVLYELMR